MWHKATESATFSTEFGTLHQSRFMCYLCRIEPNINIEKFIVFFFKHVRSYLKNFIHYLHLLVNVK